MDIDLYSLMSNIFRISYRDETRITKKRIQMGIQKKKWKMPNYSSNKELSINIIQTIRLEIDNSLIIEVFINKSQFFIGSSH